MPVAPVAHSGDGEVVLGADFGDEFDGTSLSADWETNTFDGAGSVTVGGGDLVLNGGRAKPVEFFSPVRSLEFVATFTAAPFQHLGLADAFDGPPWGMFSTGGDGASLKVRTDDTNSSTPATPDFVIPGNWLGSEHRYRIDVLPSEVVYSIDGAEVMRHAATFPADLRPVGSDFQGGGGALTVDWLDLSPYASSCSFVSAPLDAGSAVDWTELSAATVTPANTSVVLETSSSPDGSSWSPFAAVSGSTIGSPNNRFLRYRATLSSADDRHTPALQTVAVVAAPVGETVPPATAMLVPANNAFVRGNVVLDASATDNVGVTEVDFLVTGPGLDDVPVARRRRRRTSAGWASGTRPACRTAPTRCGVVPRTPPATRRSRRRSPSRSTTPRRRFR